MLFHVLLLGCDICDFRPYTTVFDWLLDPILLFLFQVLMLWVFFATGVRRSTTPVRGSRMCLVSQTNKIWKNVVEPVKKYIMQLTEMASSHNFIEEKPLHFHSYSRT